MSFQGDVRGIGLAELLQGLARGRKEGILTLSAKGGGRSVLGVESGSIFLLPDPDEQVLRFLQASRLAFDGDLRSARGRDSRTRRRGVIRLDARVQAVAPRLANIPVTHLVAMKLVVNQAYDNMGLHGTQTLGLILDGIMRNTLEGPRISPAEAGSYKVGIVSLKDARGGSAGAPQ